MHGLGEPRNSRSSESFSIYLKEGDILDFEFYCEVRGSHSEAWIMIFAMFE